MNRIDRFKELCRLTQSELKSEVYKKLRFHGYDPIYEDGFVYAKGSEPVLLIAHMDTVHTNVPTVIKEKKEQGKTVISSPYGIGGDDRCGIFMVLDIIQELKCSVLFTEDEEIGCVGANKFAQSPICKEVDANFLIELDRANKNDAVFYECDNTEFTDLVTESYYDLKYGTYTDICVIAPKIGVAAVNLSCGYYKQHTLEEYVVFEEMLDNISHVKDLIRRGKDIKYEYIEAIPYENELYGYGLDYWDYDYRYCNQYYIVYNDNGEQTIVEEEGSNKNDALLRFFINNDNIAYKDVVAILSDKDIDQW